MAQKGTRSAALLKLQIKELEDRYSKVVELQHELLKDYGGKAVRALAEGGLESVSTRLVKLKSMTPAQLQTYGADELAKLTTIVRKSQGHFKQALNGEDMVEVLGEMGFSADEALISLFMGDLRANKHYGFSYSSEGNEGIDYGLDQDEFLSEVTDFLGIDPAEAEAGFERRQKIAQDILSQTKSMNKLRTVAEAKRMLENRKAKKTLTKSPQPKVKANIKKAMKLDAQIKARATYAQPKRAKNRVKSEQVKVTEITF